MECGSVGVRRHYLEAGDARPRSEETPGSDRGSRQWSRQWERKRIRRQRAEEKARLAWEQRPLEERVLHLEDDTRWWRSWYGKIRPVMKAIRWDQTEKITKDKVLGAMLRIRTRQVKI